MVQSVRRIAAELMKCGTSRVRIQTDKEVEEALTKNDVRDLIKKGTITKVNKKGTSKAFSKKRLHQKKQGRRTGFGSRKGTAHARSPPKQLWIADIRAQRKLLKELRDSNQIDRNIYRTMYLRIKGGFFRNKSHFLYYLKEHDYLKAKKQRKKTTSKRDVHEKKKHDIRGSSQEKKGR